MNHNPINLGSTLIKFFMIRPFFITNEEVIFVHYQIRAIVRGRIELVLN
jgi:hypothetical protein